MSNTTRPILGGFVKRGLLKDFTLETIQEVPGEHEHGKE